MTNNQERVRTSAFCKLFDVAAYKESKRHQLCVDSSAGGYAKFYYQGELYQCDCPCHPWSNREWEE